MAAWLTGKSPVLTMGFNTLTTISVGRTPAMVAAQASAALTTSFSWSLCAWSTCTHKVIWCPTVKCGFIHLEDDELSKAMEAWLQCLLLHHLCEHSKDQSPCAATRRHSEQQDWNGWGTTSLLGESLPSFGVLEVFKQDPEHSTEVLCQTTSGSTPALPGVRLRIYKQCTQPRHPDQLGHTGSPLHPLASRLHRLEKGEVVAWCWKNKISPEEWWSSPV